MLCAKITEIGSSSLKLFKIKLVTFLRHAVHRPMPTSCIKMWTKRYTDKWYK